MIKLKLLNYLLELEGLDLDQKVGKENHHHQITKNKKNQYERSGVRYPWDKDDIGLNQYENFGSE